MLVVEVVVEVLADMSTFWQSQANCTPDTNYLSSYSILRPI